MRLKCSKVHVDRFKNRWENGKRIFNKFHLLNESGTYIVLYKDFDKILKVLKIK